MYTDNDLLFSNAQALNTGATETVSTLVIDLDIEGNDNSFDMGVGEEVVFEILCTTLVTTAATVTFQVVVDTLATLASAEVVVAATGAIAVADLAPGHDPVILRVNPNAFLDATAGGERFFGLRYVTNANPSTGAFTAYLGVDATSKPHNYPSKFTVA